MSIISVYTFARAEIQTLVKLVRSWFFIVVGIGVSSTYFALVTWHHVKFSSFTPSLGSLGPRYCTATLAIYFIGVFSMCVVLTSMDIRTRDLRVNIFEVIATRPVANFELLLGRLIGNLVFFAAPMIIFLAIITLYGSLSNVFAFPYGEPVAHWSVISITFLDIVPNLFFVGSLVVLLTILLRSRLTAVTIVILLVFLGLWFHFRLPHFVTAPFQTITANVLFPSELAPRFLSVGVLANRLALISAGLSFVVLAGLLQQRVSKTGRIQFLCGGGLILVALVLVGGNVIGSELRDQWHKQWSVAHQRLIPASFPDIVHLGGSVDVRPGKLITFNFELKVTTPEDNPSDWVVYSLNPGYRIESISIDGGLLDEKDDYQFQNGLLRIDKNKFINELTFLKISGRGRPNLTFAFLDTPEEVRRIVGPATRRLYHMGTENSIFHPRYVALLAATKWYPTSGSSWQEWNRDRRTKDFFEVDLTISVPQNWTIAGLRHRVGLDYDERVRFQVNPQLPVPEIALIGSNFIRRSISVSGYEFELLISQGHRQMLRPFLPLAQEGGIRTWVSNTIERMNNQAKLEYPYSMLSVVEVPSTLRTYGSGWQLDSTLSAPGIIMLRETGLPTSRFEPWSEKQYIESETWTVDKQVASFLMHQLMNYFVNDMQGENPSIGVFRQLFEYQTAPSGIGANALQFILLDRVANRSSFVGSTFFSFWECVQPSYAKLFSLNEYWGRKRSVVSMQRVLNSRWDRLTDTRRVWEHLESQALTDLSDQTEPQVIHGVLLAKASQLPLGPETSQRPDDVNTADTLESDLLKQYRGTTFLVENFLEMDSVAHENFRKSIFKLISTRGLAGFQIGDPHVEVHTDEIAGVSAYIHSFKIRNTQPASGSIAVAWDLTPELDPGSPIPKYEYSMFDITGEQSYLLTKRSTVPLERVWVKTGLSLNRNNLLRLDFTNEPEESLEPIADLLQITQIDWSPPIEQTIIIDDLDPGFAIARHMKEPIPARILQYMASLFSRPKVMWDYGLPVMHYESYSEQEVTTNSTWVREFGERSFGRYRKTYAQFIPGSVSIQNPIKSRRQARNKNQRLKQKIASARFSTTLPREGTWKLSYHLPFESNLTDPIQRPFTRWQDPFISGPLLYLPRLDLGTITLEIHNHDNVYHSKVDFARAPPGWLEIGTYELNSTTVEVYVSNVTDGEIVIADAIRWSPMPSVE